METREFVPYLNIKGASQAVEFYSRVFETSPWVILYMPDGRVMHCEFRVGGARFYISEELPEHGGSPSPETLGASTVVIHHYVSNCDHMVEKMRALGSEVLMGPVDMFFGERFARVRDPFGHEWGISTKTQEMSPEELKSAADNFFKENGAE